jgi:hypothetical protein
VSVPSDVAVPEIVSGWSLPFTVVGSAIVRTSEPSLTLRSSRKTCVDELESAASAPASTVPPARRTMNVSPAPASLIAASVASVPASLGDESLPVSAVPVSCVVVSFFASDAVVVSPFASFVLLSLLPASLSSSPPPHAKTSAPDAIKANDERTRMRLRFMRAAYRIPRPPCCDFLRLFLLRGLGAPLRIRR